MASTALYDDALREVMFAARLVPAEHRCTFLERVARALHDQQAIGPGNAHRIAYRLARELQWDAGR